MVAFEADAAEDFVDVVVELPVEDGAGELDVFKKPGHEK